MCGSCLPTVDKVFSVEVGGNETQFTLRELQPNQAYRLRITAGTGVGFGVPSEWAHHETLASYNHSDHSSSKEDSGPGSLTIRQSLLLSCSEFLWDHICPFDMVFERQDMRTYKEPHFSNHLFN